MNGHAGDFVTLWRDAVVDQLLSRLWACDQVEAHVMTGPTLPESVAGVCHDSDERNLVRQFQFLEDARDGVLRERVNADDDVRTPALEEVAEQSDASPVKEVSGFGSKAIDGPVEILHPMLAMTQDPIVEPDQLCRNLMRFLDGAHHPHGVGASAEEFLDTGHNRSGSRPMAAARVRRDDQNFRNSCSKHFDFGFWILD